MAQAIGQDRLSLVNSALNETIQGGRWGGSLDEIKQSAAVLLDVNKELLREYELLNRQVVVLEAAVLAQRRKNTDLATSLESHQQAIKVRQDAGDMNQQIARAEKDLLSARQSALSFQERLKESEEETGLGQMKIQALQLEKQALLFDRQGRSGSVLEVLQQSVRSLKDRVVAQQAQTAFIREKINELTGIDRPHLKEARQYTQDNARIRSDLTRLTRERDELLAQIDAAIEKKNGVALNSGMREAKTLIVRQQALENRVAAVQARKQELALLSEKQKAQAEDVARQIKELETENRQLESSMGNVRENIAVLEYRINTVTRYKNRNTAKK